MPRFDRQPTSHPASHNPFSLVRNLLRIFFFGHRFRSVFIYLLFLRLLFFQRRNCNRRKLVVVIAVTLTVSGSVGTAGAYTEEGTKKKN